MLRTEKTEVDYRAANRSRVNVYTKKDNRLYSCYGDETLTHKPESNLRYIASFENLSSAYNMIIVQCPICKLVYKLLKMDTIMRFIESEKEDLVCKN